MVEKTAVRRSRILSSVVPARPIGRATNSTRPKCYLFESRDEGEYLSAMVAVCFHGLIE